MGARSAPSSIHIASLALLLAISVQAGLAFQLASWSSVGLAQYLFAAAVFGLLVWGIARGYRLAWLWGRYLSFFLALLMLGVVAASLRGPVAVKEVAIVLLGLVAPLVVVSVALGRRSALEYFDLVCPRCGTVVRRGKDFLFRQARCPSCQQVW
jgi:hypothetical protein